MISLNCLYKYLYVLCICLLFQITYGSILDYFPLGKSLFGSSVNDENSNELAMQKVPYEVEVTDAKFIEQAAKFTGVSLSDLDRCQHRVIMKLQTECHKLNDEDLAKLAVKLLNCQSAIEGRTVYPCNDNMGIRDCTSNMDPDTWNSYLLMSNRARAVCYSIRQAQFRGLTEMTVNKLMEAAHEQLAIMGRLSNSQSRVEEVTAAAFERVAEDTAALQEQQRDLQRAQLHGQLALEDNIRRLANEKQFIIEGHEQLAAMTRDVQNKLDEASKQLDDQANERRDNHKEILNDLIEIQKQAKIIFERIEQSSRDLLVSSQAATTQYQSTLQHLSEINTTMATLGSHVAWLGTTMENHIKWLGEALGGTDDALDRVYLVSSHVMFLMIGMVACAFLQVSPAGRVGLVFLVPGNLIMALQKQQALSVQGLTIATIAFIIAQALLNFALHLWYKRQQKPLASITSETKENITLNGSLQTTHNNSHNNTHEENDTYDTTVNSTFSDSFSYRRGTALSNYNTYRRYDLDSTDNQSANEDFDFASPTPPLSRQSRSRSKTPSTLNGSERQRCGAITRLGTPCKSMSLLGREYCYRHQTGSSVIVE